MTKPGYGYGMKVKCRILILTETNAIQKHTLISMHGRLSQKVLGIHTIHALYNLFTFYAFRSREAHLV
jgi:hypothetical protein